MLFPSVLRTSLGGDGGGELSLYGTLRVLGFRVVYRMSGVGYGV